jgi:hypothetical protein
MPAKFTIRAVHGVMDGAVAVNQAGACAAHRLQIDNGAGGDDGVVRGPDHARSWRKETFGRRTRVCILSSNGPHPKPSKRTPASFGRSIVGGV